MKVSTDSVPGETSLSGLQKPPSGCVLTWPFLGGCVWGKRERSPNSFFFI